MLLLRYHDPQTYDRGVQVSVTWAGAIETISTMKLSDRK